jgi:two-component system cell cycle sensor histidine kinase/response regulator CckA
VVIGDGRIVLVNDRAEELYGWSRDELLGRRVDELLTSDALYLQRRKQADGVTGPIGAMGAVTTTVRRRDGTEIPVESSVTLVDTPQGRLAVAVIRDITERLRAAADLAALRSERLESLGQLAGGIAHDFNNMLGVIVNYANFVIEEATSEAPDASMIAADAQQVIKAGERGTDLTHRLLAFARREVVRPEVLDLNQVISAVEGTLRESLGPEIKLFVRPDPSLPPVTCDPAQIEQMLLNLASNARDAMPSGGNLVIDTSGHGAQVRLRVSDSGKGMAPDVVSRAFDPFFSTGQGTGLGLATVHGIAAQAGGEVSIQSSPGLGTTVTVLLPSAPSSSGGDSPASVPAAGHGETLLVVEDEDALREVAGRILSGAGYKVISADGGPQALEVAARHDGAIDLLVSDVVMPGMLGKELADRLTGVRPDTRVLYMSGYAQPVLHSQGTLDPGVALLEKPFTADDLLTAVRRRLDG